MENWHLRKSQQLRSNTRSHAGCVPSQRLAKLRSLCQVFGSRRRSDPDEKDVLGDEYVDLAPTNQCRAENRPRTRKNCHTVETEDDSDLEAKQCTSELEKRLRGEVVGPGWPPLVGRAPATQLTGTPSQTYEEGHQPPPQEVRWAASD